MVDMSYAVPFFGGLLAFVATASAASRLMGSRRVGQRRKFPRYPMKTSAMLRWRDPNGNMRAVRARTVGISEHGLSVRCRQPLNRDAAVFVSLEKYGFALAGYVRHCEKNWRGHVIGIEVQGPPIRSADGSLKVNFVSA